MVDSNKKISAEAEPRAEPPPTDWQAYAQYHYKWNHFWGLLCSTAAMNAVGSVTSALIRDIIDETGSAFLLRYVNTIASFLSGLAFLAQYLPPLFIANYLETKERKKSTFIWLAIVTCSFVGSWSVITYFLVHAAPVLSLPVFCVLYPAFSFCMGCLSVIMSDVFGKAIPIEKRNGFWGNRFSLSCVAMFLMAYLIKRILDPQNTTDVFREGYSVLYLVALGYVIFAYFSFHLMKEPVHKVRHEKKAMMRFLMDAFRTALIQDKNYRAFIAMRILQTLGGLAAALGVLYLTEELGLPTSAQGTAWQYVAAANFVAFFLFGRLGNIVGSKVLLQIGSLFGMLASFGMAAIPILARKFHVAFEGSELSSIMLGLYILMTVLSQLNYSSTTIGRNNYPIDIAPATLRPTYIGFATAVPALFGLMQGLGGAIADYSSRQVVFALTGVFFLLSLIPSLWMENVTRDKRRAELAGK